MRDTAYIVATLATLCLGACKADWVDPPNVGKGQPRTCRDVREGAPPPGAKQRQALWSDTIYYDHSQGLSWAFDATFDIADSRVFPKEICLRLDDPSNRIGVETSMDATVATDGTMRVLITFLVTAEAPEKTWPPRAWVSWLVEIHGDSTANVTFFPSQRSLGTVGTLASQTHSPRGVEVADQIDTSERVHRIP